MNQFRLHWDRDYGCDKKTGWSISIDGSFVANLERFLIVAIVKAIIKYLRQNK
jgi:hypothetical protein